MLLGGVWLHWGEAGGHEGEGHLRGNHTEGERPSGRVGPRGVGLAGATLETMGAGPAAQGGTGHRPAGDTGDEVLCAPQGASACRRAHIAVHVCACTGSPHHLYPHTHMHTHTGVHTHAGYSCTHIHASTPRMCTSQCVTWAHMCTPMFVHARRVCTCICMLYISLCVHMFHACARMPRVCAHMCAIPAHVCGCMCTRHSCMHSCACMCIVHLCAHTAAHTHLCTHTQVPRSPSQAAGSKYFCFAISAALPGCRARPASSSLPHFDGSVCSPLTPGCEPTCHCLPWPQGLAHAVPQAGSPQPVSPCGYPSKRVTQIPPQEASLVSRAGFQAPRCPPVIISDHVSLGCGLLSLGHVSVQPPGRGPAHGLQQDLRGSIAEGQGPVGEIGPPACSPCPPASSATLDACSVLGSGACEHRGGVHPPSGPFGLCSAEAGVVGWGVGASTLL